MDTRQSCPRPVLGEEAKPTAKDPKKLKVVAATLVKYLNSVTRSRLRSTVAYSWNSDLLRNGRYQPYSQRACDMVHPMATRVAVLCNEGVFAYHLLADITWRRQTCRTTGGTLNKRHRKARDRQTETGRFVHSRPFQHDQPEGECYNYGFLPKALLS